MVSTSSKIYQPGISSSTVIHVASLTCSPAMSCHSHVTTGIVWHRTTSFYMPQSVTRMSPLASHLFLNFNSLFLTDLSPATELSLTCLLLFYCSHIALFSFSFLFSFTKVIFILRKKHPLYRTIAGFVTGQQTAFQSIFKCIII